MATPLASAFETVAAVTIVNFSSLSVSSAPAVLPGDAVERRQSAAAAGRRKQRLRIKQREFPISPPPLNLRVPNPGGEREPSHRDRNKKEGKICAITIERARERTQIPSFSYELITA
jgi:hypothetical protein